MAKKVKISLSLFKSFLFCFEYFRMAPSIEGVVEHKQEDRNRRKVYGEI
jgi:hypothetical protein